MITRLVLLTILTILDVAIIGTGFSIMSEQEPARFMFLMETFSYITFFVSVVFCFRLIYDEVSSELAR